MSESKQSRNPFLYVSIFATRTSDTSRQPHVHASSLFQYHGHILPSEHAHINMGSMSLTICVATSTTPAQILRMKDGAVVNEHN